MDLATVTQTIPPWLPAGEYQGLVKEWHDGDTCTLLLFVELKGRSNGIQAPEIHGPEAARAAQAQKRATALTANQIVSVKVAAGYKYGENGERMVSVVAANGKNVADVLIAEGLGVKWDGRGPRPVGQVFYGDGEEGE